MRTAIRLAGGREVCFVATWTTDGVVQHGARRRARRRRRACSRFPALAERGEMLLHNHPSGVARAVGRRISTSPRACTTAASASGSSTTTRRELYVVVEVPTRAESRALDPASSIADDLGPDGADRRAASRATRIARASARWRATIATLYNDGGVGLLEAGTGVGKSLGYLVPALRWAAANGERTVVSTNTINLQEQLVGKDLPFLARRAHRSAGALRAAQGMAQLSLPRCGSSRRSSAGPRCSTMALRTELEDDSRVGRAHGRRLARRSADAAARRGVGRGRGGAGPLPARCKCPHFDEVLSLQGATRGGAGGRDRRQSSSAARPISPCAARRQNWDDAAVLPAYSASSSTKGIISRMRRRRTSARPSRAAGCSGCSRGSSGAARGCCRALAHELAVAEGSAEHREPRSAAGASRARGARGARKSDAACSICSTRISSESNEPVVAADATTFATHPIWRAGSRVVARATLLRELELLAGWAAARARAHGGERRRATRESRRCSTRCAASRGGSRALATRCSARSSPRRATSRRVRWLEVRGRERNVAATRRAARHRADSARGSVQARRHRGRHERDARDAAGSLRLPRSAARARRRVARRRRARSSRRRSITRRRRCSPCRPTSPRRTSNPAGHLRARRRASRSTLAEASDGGLFVLFTSHRDVREVARELRARGHRARAGRCSCTARSPRRAARAAFANRAARSCSAPRRSGKASTLPGDALRGLVIAKLPFRVPTEPVTAAQCEAIEARGGDPFAELHAAARVAAAEAGLRPARFAPEPTAASWCHRDPRVVTKAIRARAARRASAGAARRSAPWSVVLRAAAATSIASSHRAEHIDACLSRPGKIVCVGRNYLEHAKELGNDVPKEPLLFLKPPSSVIGTDESIVLPAAVAAGGVRRGDRRRHRRDFSRARSARGARARSRGIVAVNDVTARDLQKTDGSGPAPRGSTRSARRAGMPRRPDDLDALTVVTRVNGVERQRGVGRDMVFSIPTLLAYISTIMTLEPGDLVATGTPAASAPRARRRGRSRDRRREQRYATLSTQLTH